MIALFACNDVYVLGLALFTPVLNGKSDSSIACEPSSRVQIHNLDDLLVIASALLGLPCPMHETASPADPLRMAFPDSRTRETSATSKTRSGRALNDR